ncbi:MAG: hypothetical protein A2651_01040 [Candidatus Yanofskybacteria bacterium RIFCSPHIGHO2_01_FULL_42_12]|uniref:Proteasome subunit beta n=1 Tax=Candidatus Yanofskybacteria bacterium RIFCSPLOWO2_01_FULL_42_49 TaxID=1802694 RepID=A0A1F8GCU7_9BACT|nr:MAG: hypothetical protein A2651_01040 [Candidatus Yanofskybacteria bacterium RIFCSPHIGHO2_01_FULL_42_12]OGN22578.1 MAG: hypothetical protein A2918_02340 [Candidatus Yanofskybacteria bacterium RIFCSPLOWO2_01_FULL_42_49]
MRREIFEEALRSTIPESALLSETAIKANGRPNFENQKEGYKTLLDSGTTILAFHFKHGVMLAGDRQTSSWFSIMSQETVKVSQIGLYSGFMFAGMVSDGQAVAESLRRADRDFRNRFGVPLSLDGMANYLSRFLRIHYNHGIFLEAWGIIAGFNFNPLESKIYSVEPAGSKTASIFATTGSGGDRAEDELERFRGKIKTLVLDTKEALELAVRAVYMAGKKDMGTSDVRLAVPSVAVITADRGFEFIKPDRVKEARDRLVDQERRDGNVA